MEMILQKAPTQSQRLTQLKSISSNFSDIIMLNVNQQGKVNDMKVLTSICVIPIESAMKQPVRPRPALKEKKNKRLSKN